MHGILAEVRSAERVISQITPASTPEVAYLNFLLAKRKQKWSHARERFHICWLKPTGRLNGIKDPRVCHIWCKDSPYSCKLVLNATIMKGKHKNVANGAQNGCFHAEQHKINVPAAQGLFQDTLRISLHSVNNYIFVKEVFLAINVPFQIWKKLNQCFLRS